MVSFRTLQEKLLAATILSAFLFTPLAIHKSFAQSEGTAVFDRMLANAQRFALSFPQEKVYLHTDNTSYMQGDTIWYKAYVVLADNNMPTNVSKPLYVEVLDQLGNIVEKQIVEINNGCAVGQIPLNNTVFSGYFELRAYTKWMMSSPCPQYFSRVLPIYRRIPGDTENRRELAHYDMRDSKSVREKNGEEGLTVHFYPEGGRLVKGLPTKVAFEVSAADSGTINTTGVLHDGPDSSPIRSLMDGIGTFVYTPGDTPATVTVDYKGSQKRFELPRADDSGVSLSLVNMDSLITVSVAANGSYRDSSLALFVYSHSIPLLYKTVSLRNGQMIFQIPTRPIQPGVNRVALLNTRGEVMADRLFFVYPSDEPTLSATKAKAGDSAIVLPFHKIRYQINVKHANGTPVKGSSLSVSVRQALNADYERYADNVASDLLLSSELKGYIPRPAFYLKDRKSSTRALLDNLLLVRGWRRYDIQRESIDTTYMPRILPEHSLTLYGKVKSTFSRSQNNIVVTVLAQQDSTFAAGSTKTDGDGSFSLPLNDIDGDMEAHIQTRKEGKNINRYTSVQLFRDFGPKPRAIDYQELHPVWDSLNIDNESVYKADSAYYAEINKDIITLDEVTVKAKNKARYAKKEAENFERKLIGFYDVRQYIDGQRDKGKEVYELDDLLEGLNDNINATMSDSGTFAGGTTDESQLTIRYGTMPLIYYVNGKRYDDLFFMKDVDAMKSIMLYEDNNANNNQVYSIDRNFQVHAKQAKEGWSGADIQAESGVSAQKNGVVCAIQMIDGWDPQKVFKINRGIRLTRIMGYTRPSAFYSPSYPDPTKAPASDRRTTLYWNPNVVTDDNGQAVVECYNSALTTIPELDAQTIADGSPIAVSYIVTENK